MEQTPEGNLAKDGRLQGTKMVLSQYLGGVGGGNYSLAAFRPPSTASGCRVPPERMNGSAIIPLREYAKKRQLVRLMHAPQCLIDARAASTTECHTRANEDWRAKGTATALRRTLGGFAGA
ncbi:hypothetical protein V2G26_009374 [Clonostachys chloroleuca]